MRTTSNCRRGAPFALALFSAILIISYSGPASAAEFVAVHFEVQATSFVNNLETGRAQVEMITTATLVEVLNRYFPPVSWRPAPQPGAAATLTISLAARAAQPTPAIFLEWNATVEGKAIGMPELPGIELYGPFDMVRETHDPVALSAILKKELEDWFEISSNRSLFQRSFLRNVPVARSVTVDAATQRIVMPISMASTKMDAQSSLRVRFEIMSGGGAPQNGELKLSSLLPLPVAGVPATRGKVVEFNFSGAPAVDGWSSQIPILFSRPGSKSSVFIELYIYSEANTVDGNFQNP